MFLFKVGFNNLIKIFSWISSLKLHELSKIFRTNNCLLTIKYIYDHALLSYFWHISLWVVKHQYVLKIIVLCCLVLPMYSALQLLHLNWYLTYILKVHNSCLILSLKLKKVFMHQEILTIILKSQAGSNCLNVLCNMTLSSVEIIPVPLARA